MVVPRLAAVVLVAVLGACSAGRDAASAGEATVALGEGFALPYGKTANVADVRISFAAVTADSRCPRKVVCVWAGDAAIVLEVKHAAETRSVELHTTPSQGRGEAFGHRIDLVKLEPHPEEPSGLKPSAYVAHLVVDGKSEGER